MAQRIIKDFDVKIHEKREHDICSDVFITTKDGEIYKDYLSKDKLDEWLELSNLRLIFKETTTGIAEDNGEMTISKYEAKGIIQEVDFWDISEVPADNISCRGRVNGSIEDCYSVHTQSGSKLYKPHPDTIETQSFLDEHIQIIKISD